jgi:hypothetical protein
MHPGSPLALPPDSPPAPETGLPPSHASAFSPSQSALRWAKGLASSSAHGATTAPSPVLAKRWDSDSASHPRAAYGDAPPPARPPLQATPSHPRHPRHLLPQPGSQPAPATHPAPPPSSESPCTHRPAALQRRFSSKFGSRLVVCHVFPRNQILKNRNSFPGTPNPPLRPTSTRRSALPATPFGCN